MENDYYVYEILIDDEVIYVGISQNRDSLYKEDNPHHYLRLRDHGYFTAKCTAKRVLENKNFLTRKKEILEAIVQDKKLSYNIVLNHVDANTAGKKEQELINKYKCKVITELYKVDNDGNITGIEKIVNGQLINKINSPNNIVKNSSGTFDNNKNTAAWWHNLSEDEKEQYKEVKSKAMKDYILANPEKWKQDSEKRIKAGVYATSKIGRSEETFKKQSENMKKRWARGEAWIEKKNKLSSEVLKRLNAERPEIKEMSRERCLKRNSDPTWQLRKVKKIYDMIVKYNKDLDNWKQSYHELVTMGVLARKSYRDWKKYFKSLEEVKNYES